MTLTLWKLAMLWLLPLLFVQVASGGGWPFHKLRTWAAVLGSSVAAYLVTPTEGYAPLLAYALIDFSAACIVLVKPAGVAQRAVGLAYVAMILFHCGAGAGGNYSGDGFYRTFLISAGWFQWAVLLVWSGWDVGRALLAAFGWRGGVAVAEADSGTGGR